MRELIHTEERDGFYIRFYAMPEHTAPDDCFDDDGQTARDIAAGVYEWFTACVTASKAGVELGADYLGCCCYERAADFVEELYYEDMALAAMNEARETIALLCRETA